MSDEDQTSRRRRPRTLGAKACSNCHNRKVRCDLQPGIAACSNCRALKQECRPHTRKKRRLHNAPIQHSLSHTSGPAGTSPDLSLYPAETGVRIAPNIPVSHAGVGTTPKTREPSAQNYSSPSGSYLGRAEYISSIVPIDEEDARKYTARHEDALSEFYQKFLRDIQAFDLPPRSVRDSLVTNFMERCHPWMPIVDNMDMEQLNDSRSSILLLQAIFVAGSKVSTAPHAQNLGETFYQRAKALYYANVEKNPLAIIQAICLLQWWNPSGPEHVSMDSSSFWLHMGVALAHQVGLHRDPAPSQPDAGFRRRLWWTLFTRDCIISSSHGRPRAIGKKNFDVRPLTADDFPTNSEDARLFITYVNICSILGDLTEHSVRGTLGRSSRTSIEERLFRWMSDLPSEFHLHDRMSGHICPYNFKARQLHVPYFTALSILFRPTIVDTPPSVATVLSSSFVVGIYEDFLARGEIPLLGPVFIFHLLAAALAELACHNYPVLWEKTEKELEVVNQALEEFAHKFPSAFGGQRVVKAVTAAVRKQKTQRKSYQSAVAPEQFKYFRFFGPDLCSKWELVYGRKAETEATRAVAPVASSDVFEGRSTAPLTQNSHTEDSLNADDFAVAGLISLQDPKHASGPTTTTRSFGEDLNVPTAPDAGISSSIDPALSFPFSTNSMVDPVGNWMLNDWMTDLNYWDSLVGE